MAPPVRSPVGWLFPDTSTDHSELCPQQKGLRGIRITLAPIINIIKHNVIFGASWILF